MSMTYKNHRKGFTMIELLVVLVVILIIFMGSITALMNYRKHSALERDAESVASALVEARNLTLASKNAAVYGVHLTSTTTTIFVGPTYSDATTTNSKYELSGNIVLTTDLPGGGSDILFTRLTGETNQTGTVTITMVSEISTTTIKVYKTGVVERKE
jgi:prepilin-type N-terminal cleavage/methylation domain-containing protein